MAANLACGPLVAATQNVRIEALRALTSAYERMRDPESADFADAVAALIVLDVDAASIARRVKVSTATVTRWSQGVSSPHPLARPTVIEALRATALAEIELARTIVASAA
jgi:hypothetical protein